MPISAMANGVISAVSAMTPAMTAQGPRVVASLSHSVRMRRVIAASSFVRVSVRLKNAVSRSTTSGVSS